MTDENQPFGDKSGVLDELADFVPMVRVRRTLRMRVQALCGLSDSGEGQNRDTLIDESPPEGCGPQLIMQDATWFTGTPKR